MPRQWLARVLAVLWMFTGVVFVAFYTAQLTATLTVQQIQGTINGPDDLQGKKVATTRGSTAAAYLRELRAQVLEVAVIEDAYQALLNKEADAVVFDAPILLYYAANEGKGRVHMVGLPFRGRITASCSVGQSASQTVNARSPVREDGSYRADLRQVVFHQVGSLRRMSAAGGRSRSGQFPLAIGGFDC